jgi:hypothetical protein
MASRWNRSGWKARAAGTLLVTVLLSWAWTATFGVRDAKLATAMRVGKSPSTDLFTRLEAVAVAPFVVKVAYYYSVGFCGEEGTTYMACLPGLTCKVL